MNIFISYTITLILLVSFLFVFSYFCLKKKIKIKDAIFLAIGVIFAFHSIYLIQKGNDLLKKATFEIKAPNELYSTIESKDSIITDKILYSYLLSMRAPHPEIILIQAKIESNNYSSPLFKRNWNLFGMKTTSSRVTTTSTGRAGYQEYKGGWKESVYDYIFWEFNNNVDKLSQNEYLLYLQKIYAEDPNYSKKIRAQLNNINFKALRN